MTDSLFSFSLSRVNWVNVSLSQKTLTTFSINCLVFPLRFLIPDVEWTGLITNLEKQESAILFTLTYSHKNERSTFISRNRNKLPKRNERYVT